MKFDAFPEILILICYICLISVFLDVCILYNEVWKQIGDKEIREIPLPFKGSAKERVMTATYPDTRKCY